MSVRAYRVIEIQYEKQNSFNLWRDGKLMDFLDRRGCFYDSLNEDSVGLTEVSIKVLQKALQEVELEPEVREIIQKDIEACKDSGYVQYYCF